MTFFCCSKNLLPIQNDNALVSLVCNNTSFRLVVVSLLQSPSFICFCPLYTYSRYLQNMSTGCCSVKRRSWRRWSPQCQMAGSLSRSAYVPAKSRGPDCSGLWVGLMLSWFSNPSVLLPLPEPSPDKWNDTCLMSNVVSCFRLQLQKAFLLHLLKNAII